MLFERSYTPSAVCCPARAMILSGAYHWHNGVYNQVHSAPSVHRDMNPGVVLFPTGCATPAIVWGTSASGTPLTCALRSISDSTRSPIWRDRPAPHPAARQQPGWGRTSAWPDPRHHGPEYALARLPTVPDVGLPRRAGGGDSRMVPGGMRRAHVAPLRPRRPSLAPGSAVSGTPRPLHATQEIPGSLRRRALPVPLSFQDTFAGKPGLHRRESETGETSPKTTTAPGAPTTTPMPSRWMRKSAACSMP